MRRAALVLLAGALPWGCSQPANPPPRDNPAIEARLSADEARIALLEGRLNAQEAARAPVAAATPATRIFTLVETTKAPDEAATVTRTPFQNLAECQAARQKALADASSDAQAATKTQVEQLPSGATHIIPARTPPKVTAVCGG